MRSFHQQWIDDNNSVSQGDGSLRKDTCCIRQTITGTHAMWKARTYSTLEVKLDLLGEKRGRQSFVGVKMLIEEFIKEMEEQDMIRKV